MNYTMACIFVNVFSPKKIERENKFSLVFFPWDSVNMNAVERLRSIPYQTPAGAEPGRLFQAVKQQPLTPHPAP